MWMLILAAIVLAALAGYRYARRTPPAEYLNYSDAARGAVPPYDRFWSRLKLALAAIAVVAAFVGILAVAHRLNVDHQDRRYDIERRD